jgi:ubiquinone/menaquinone biosynthesis C-methylase UbiE
MLDIARSMIDSKGWMNVEVREADAAHLPFPDASFDRDRSVISFSAKITVPAKI